MIRRFLDCSSGHLSPDTWRWLDRQFAEGELRDVRNLTAEQLAGGPTRFGWFVYAPEYAPAVPIPEDLASVLRHARRPGRRIRAVRLRRDATPMEDLPVLHPEFRDDAG